MWTVKWVLFVDRHFEFRSRWLYCRPLYKPILNLMLRHFRSAGLRHANTKKIIATWAARFYLVQC